MELLDGARTGQCCPNNSDMVGRLAGLSPFSECCLRGQEADEGAHDALDVQGGEEVPAEVRGVVVQSQVHRGPPMPFLKWKAGQTKGMIGRTVAKVAARSEGALVDEVEALDVLPAIAALNDHFKTCIFVGDENQTLLHQRRGQSPEQFPLASGRAHGAASKNRKVSKSDDVKNEVQLVDEEEEELRVNNVMLRGISDWFDKGNGNIEHLSGLTHWKRCSPGCPAITKFLSSLLTPMRPQLSQFESSSMAPPTTLHHIIYSGSGWWTWAQLCDCEKTARAQRREAANKLRKVSFNPNTSSPKQQVVWHEVATSSIAGSCGLDLQEMHAGERMLIICFLSRFSELVTALLAAFLSEEDAKACGCASLGQCSWTDR